LIAALVALVSIYVVTQVEVRTDPRPLGTVEDIEALAKRDDLNVIFILVDTLRADRLHTYGYERQTSPVLDYLAESGARFDRTYAQSSWTKASMASLWTGIYPVRTGVTRAQDAVSDEARMPAEIFRDAGYRTAAIWRNGWVAPNFGFAQGFEVYQSPLAGQLPDSLKSEVRAGRIAGSDIDAVYTSGDFLRTHRNEKFFLYLHLMDVHQYVSDTETAIFGSTYSDSYDNSILWTDRQIGAILAEVDRLGLRSRTMIVIAADHGEAFGEHGREGHARDVHVEVTHVPWIISFPFRLDPGVAVTSLTANVDIWPTILDLAGLPGLTKSDGRSRVPAMLDDGLEDDSVEFAYIDRTWGKVKMEPDPVVAIRNGSKRLIHRVNDPEKDQLYAWTTDRAERSDLVREDVETAKALRSSLDSHLESEVVFGGGAPRVEIGDMELRQLRALGYAVE